MNRTYRLGYFGNLRVLAKGTAVVGVLLLWLLLSAIGAFLFDLAPGAAILTGLIATILHEIAVIGHHLGHAWAARRTGYPMTGIFFVWILATSLYPPKEPELPGRIHIRRALGGPTGSLLLAIVAGVVVLLLPSGSVPYLLAQFLFWDSFLVFTIGALLPLGFTDGTTLLTYWGRD